MSEYNVAYLEQSCTKEALNKYQLFPRNVSNGPFIYSLKPVKCFLIF